MTAIRAAFLHIANVPMSTPARLVLLALSNRHNQETGRCDPSNATLCGDTQHTERTVRKAIRELERLRLITTTERKQRSGRGKRNLTNRYRLKGGVQYAGGMGSNMPPKQESIASAYDDLVFAISVESENPAPESPCQMNGNDDSDHLEGDS